MSLQVSDLKESINVGGKHQKDIQSRRNMSVRMKHVTHRYVLLIKFSPCSNKGHIEEKDNSSYRIEEEEAEEALFYVLFLRIGAHGTRRNHKETSTSTRARARTHTHTHTHTHTRTHAHTHTQTTHTHSQ